MADIISFLNAINTGINYIAAVVFIFFLFYLVVNYSIRKISGYIKKGEGPGKGVFLGIISLIEAIIFGYFIVWLPILMERFVLQRMDWIIKAQVFRWVFLYLTLPLLVYFLTRRNSRLRGLYVTEAVLTIGLVGWLYERWLGVIFISIPIYFILIFLIFRLAQVVLPASDPSDPGERWPKFRALLFYFLGLQFPVWVARDSVAREFDKRIPGSASSRDYQPGIIWTYSHQVAGISTGSTFDQVEGPGIIFTKAHRQPVALVDLRTQARSSTIDATTRDGITFQAVLFTSFAIDPEDWPKKSWKKNDIMRMREDLRKNPALAKGIKVDRRIGNFWYSTARVKSVLSTVGYDPHPRDPEASPIVYWDDWTVRQVENAARQILSQRAVDELWRPVDNQAGTSALDEIAEKVRSIVEPELRRVGITLVTCRVINFTIPEKSPVREQQIASWKTIWDQRISAVLSDAAAVRQDEIEKAHAYAKSEVLDAIADSIEKARAESPDLPRHVIALYYINALEEIVRKQPESATQEDRERVEIWKQLLLNNQG
jgi:hypothetical protein